MLALERVSYVNELVEHAVRVVADRQRLGGVLHLMRLDTSSDVIDTFKTCAVPEHRLAACRAFTQLNRQRSCPLLSNVKGRAQRKHCLAPGSPLSAAGHSFCAVLVGLCPVALAGQENVGVRCVFPIDPV